MLRYRPLPTFLICAATTFVLGLAATSVSAGEFDGSACDDSGVARDLRRICHAYCDARECASDSDSSLSAACGRLLSRYARQSDGGVPPCEVRSSECRHACRPDARRAQRRCREVAAEAVAQCELDANDLRCAARAAADLDECLQRTRRLYRACIEECSDDGTCALPKDAGPCKAAIPRWYFDTDAGVCDRFVWGGCGGNANNFQSRDDCSATCGDPDVCALPADGGPCDGAFPRWYHDSASATCKQFTYGGCGGNDNNFQTFAECREACGAEDPCTTLRCRDDQDCLIDDDSGYAYCADNCDRRECRDGEVCVLQDVVCVRAPCPPVAVCVPDGACGEPKEVGPCLAVIPRYWHNPATGRCEQFNYGGCGGNSNNFETLVDCQLACMDCQVRGGSEICAAENCNPAENYCETFTGGVPGSQTEYQCLALPATCLEARERDCSCFDLADRGGCQCREDGDDVFVVDCFAP